MLLRAAYALAFLLPASLAFAQGADSDDEAFRNFLVGIYTIVGKQPDGGAGYTGTGGIALRGDKLVLTRTIGRRTTTADGAVERAAPPADRPRVLRFRWAAGKRQFLMTCLAQGDLDNYARLTCLWGDAAGEKAPGVEAFFRRAAGG
jgi:hypothetical protein